MIKKFFRLFLVGISIVCFAFSSQEICASVKAEGIFIAEKKCQAYVSKRKRTNPDEARLTKGQAYQILELNVPAGTTWYRIEMPNVNPGKRWVYFECGAVNITSKGSGQSSGPGHGYSGKKPCRTAGLADGYKLAVSWQPAFCESHRDKPECDVTNPDSYQASNFTLHGLWPNKNSCGTRYGFCGKYSRPETSFCKYDPVPISEELLAKLGKYMPSAAHGSCLQRHEWYKHGTCQETWSAETYYDTAIRLVQEFNGKGMSSFMEAEVGNSVRVDEFFEAVDQVLGEDAHRRMKLLCDDKRNLVDIYINLPAVIPNNASVSELIQHAPEAFGNNCGDSFVVDEIGYQ